MRALALGAAAALLAGCMKDVPGTDVHFAGAHRTGEYPNLNIRPRAAATQFSSGEVNAGKAGLRARQSAAERQGAMPHESQRERLRVLAVGNPDRAADTTGSLTAATGEARSTADIARAAQAQPPAAPHRSQRERLRALAASHGAEAIEAIENSTADE